VLQRTWPSFAPLPSHETALTRTPLQPTPQQKLSGLEKDLCQSHLENHQLRLEVHRWRKQHALVKLRLAGAQEDFDLQASHGRQLEARCETLEAQRVAQAAQIAGLKAELEGLRAQLKAQAADMQGKLRELAALKSGTEEQAAKLKEDLGNASEDQCRLTEQVRLATMRARAASESAHAMEEALAAARREADAAREQLAAVRNQSADMSASQTRLQMALEASKNELSRWVELLLAVSHSSLLCRCSLVPPCCSQSYPPPSPPKPHPPRPVAPSAAWPTRTPRAPPPRWPPTSRAAPSRQPRSASPTRTASWPSGRRWTTSARSG
jgi:hypothetical protein